MIFKAIFSFFLIFHFFVLQAQENDKIVFKNGKKYITHSVVKGETIFRLCKNYKISYDELITLNPFLSKGLQLGDVISFPYVEQEEIQNIPTIKFNVLNETTLSNVASLFYLKETDLKKLNPTSLNKLSPGSQLNVPADSLLYKSALYKSSVKVKPDTIIQYVVEQKDVLYSIAKRFMTTVKDIQAINLKTNSSIDQNSVLLIPIYNRRVLEMKYRTPKELSTEIEKSEQVSIPKVSKEQNQESVEKELVAKESFINKNIKKGGGNKEQNQKDSISLVLAEKVGVQNEKMDKKLSDSEQLEKAVLVKSQFVKDSIAKVAETKARIKKEQSEKQRLSEEQLKKSQLAKDQLIKDSISKVAEEKARIQKEQSEKQRLAEEQLKESQLAKDQLIKDSISKVAEVKARIQKEESEKQRLISDQKEKKDSTFNVEIENKTTILDSAQFKKKFVLTFLLPFNSDKHNDPTSKVATEFYMGVQLALDSLNKLKFKGQVNVFDCGNDTAKLNPLFLKDEVKASDLIIGPLNGANLIQTADFCNRNQIPMINPIMSNTALLRKNKYVYNAVTSEMSLVKGLAKYVYSKHPKHQVVLVRVGSKDDELYDEFRTIFSNQGANKLYEVTDTNMLSVIKKDKKTIFVALTRDKELATKISKRLSDYSDRNRLKGSLTLYGTKDWLNFESINEEIKKKIDFKYNSSIDFNPSNQNLAILRQKFKEKFKFSLTKYAAQGYDVTFYFVKQLLMNSNTELPMMNVFDLKRIEQNSGFENGGSYVFGYEDENITRIQVLHD